MQRIFVLAGPTNAGKDTIMRRLLPISELNLAKVVTSTSRKIRDGEIDGIDYHFYTKEEFEEKIKHGDFFEYALVHSDYKGIQKSSIYDEISKDKSMILQVDIQGYKTLKRSLDFSKYKLIGIFIMPPSIDELKKRMKIRNTEKDSKDIELRLKNAEIEISQRNIFDYVLENNDLETCIRQVIQIIKENQS